MAVAGRASKRADLHECRNCFPFDRNHSGRAVDRAGWLEARAHLQADQAGRGTEGGSEQGGDLRARSTRPRWRMKEKTACFHRLLVKRAA